MADKRRKLLIGTPAFDGRVDAWYAHCLIETTKLCMFNNIEINTVFMAYDSLLPRARNDLVKMAIDNECDDLIFIDSDQAWNPRWILKLLEHDVDVVGCPVIKKTDEVELYNVKAIYPLVVDENNGLIPVLGIGTGFLRLSNKALKAVYESSIPYTNEGKENRMVFEIMVIDGELTSEDTVLCMKLRNLGFTVWLDKNMTCSHIGAKMWRGNFSQWYDNLSK